MSVYLQQHYLMKNYDAREAVVYIGDEDDFKNIELALIAGEELNVNESDETAYEVNSLFIIKQLLPSLDR